MTNKTKHFADHVSTDEMKQIILDDLNRKINNPKGPTFKTQVIAKNELGEVLFDEHNELLLSGGLFLLQKIANVDTPITIATLNQDLNILPQIVKPPEAGLRREDALFGFVVGVGGAGDVFDTVKDVKYKERKVEGILPFRKVPTTKDLSPALRGKYFMRRQSDNYLEYYIKKFETTPVIHAEFDEPGQPAVPGDVDTQPENKIINTYIQFVLRIDKDDCRQYFQLNGGGLNKARINTLGLVHGYPDNSLGYTEYRSCRIFSKLNFNNEPLANLSKEITIIYKIYV